MLAKTLMSINKTCSNSDCQLHKSDDWQIIFLRPRFILFEKLNPLRLLNSLLTEQNPNFNNLLLLDEMCKFSRIANYSQ